MGEMIMKLFMQKPLIQKFDHAKEFVEAYQIGEGDFILASKRIYETYFAPLNLKARVEYKSNYGAGEPTDVMIWFFAIGVGAVIDMA